MEEVKTCSRCGDTKPLDAFYRQKRGLFGVMSVCKPCDRERRIARLAPAKAAKAVSDAARRAERNPIVDGVQHKTCLQCEEIKPEADFYRAAKGGLRARCISCTNEKYSTNRSKYPIIDGVQHRICCDCGLAKPFERFYANKNNKFGISCRCIECSKALYATIYEQHGESILARNRDRRRRNIDAAKSKDAERYAKRYKSTEFRLENCIRQYMRLGLKKGSKSGRRTFELLGYTVGELRDHLEKQFIDGMSWENYGRGGWHIDHRLPLAMFDCATPDSPDFKIAWALTNLQPLWEGQNFSKRDKRIYLL